MSWIAAAIVGSTVVNYMGAQSAAGTQADAANNATQAQLQMFDKTQQNLQPYMDAGGVGLDKMMAGVKDGSLMPQSYTPYTMDTFKNSPEYQVMMEQNATGLNASQNASSLNGGANSNNLKSLINWTQGNTANQYSTGLNDYVSQFLTGNNTKSQQFSTLQSLASNGQNAAANLGGISATVGSQIGGNTIGAGNAQAAGTIGATNAVTGGIGQGYNQWLQNQYMQNTAYNNIPGGAMVGNSTDMTGFYTPTAY